MSEETAVETAEDKVDQTAEAVEEATETGVSRADLDTLRAENRTAIEELKALLTPKETPKPASRPKAKTAPRAPAPKTKTDDEPADEPEAKPRRYGSKRWFG